MGEPLIVNAVVEGASDEGAARAVITAAGRDVGKIIDKRGKTRLDPDLRKYNQAARRAPWVVFRDSDGKCPVHLRAQLLEPVGETAPWFVLRIAHPMTEAWLLADPAGFAKFFGVKEAAIPADPESLTHPKRTLLRLCAASKSRAIRHDMVAPNGETGPLYVVRINEFAMESWSVQVASMNSDSLHRTVARIQQMPV